MSDDRTPQLPDDWEARDSHDCFYEYVQMMRAEWLSGRREIPAWLKSTRNEAMPK